MANQITEVRLLNVPLESDYKHTLYFQSLTEQANYFISRTLFTENDFSYQRKDNVIRYPKHYDELSECNYVMYRNLNNSSKWYYAFITEKTYINEERTDLHIETDVIQTYLFNYIVKPSFVEREHVNDDTVGLHTFPENLEVGEYVCEHRDSVTELVGTSYVVGITEVVKASTGSTTPEFEMVAGTRYDGILSGIRYLSYTTDNLPHITSLIKLYADNGKNEAIKCLFMYPTGLITNEPGNYFVLGSEKPSEISKEFTRNKIFKYTPKNKKLLTFPYQYLLVTNNNGGSAVYHFENFTNPDKVSFVVKGCITPGGSIRIIPKDYKGIDKNDEEGLNLGKFPICNWASDEYTNWLTQNSVNIGLNIASGVGQIVAGAALTVGSGGLGTAVGGGQIIGGVSTIASQLAQVHQMSFTSPQSRGNINCGDVITADGTNTFFLQQMAIKEEYMIILDNYFSMFGYKCNRVKVPLKNHRTNYWYTKTIDVNIDGAIPNKDLQNIKNCYNNGITFWKIPANIGNYNVGNEIL